MKYLLTLLLLGLGLNLRAQLIIPKPSAVYASYFGEMITHPGLKIGANYEWKNWEKEAKKSVIVNRLNLNPSVGFFYHNKYQTGIFILPEFTYSKTNDKGNYIEYGIGLGYLSTIIPKTFTVTDNGDIKKTISGHHYLLTNYSITLGKDLHVTYYRPFRIFAKPQFLLALPNFPNATGYFALELGLTYQFIDL